MLDLVAGNRTFGVIPSMMSAAVPSAGIVGALAFIEDNPHGAFPFAAGSLDGKIVLVRRGKVTFDTKTANVCTSGGAVALIVVDTNHDDSHINVNVRNWAGDHHDPDLVLAGMDTFAGEEIIRMTKLNPCTANLMPRDTLLGLSISDPDWVRCVPGGGSKDQEILQNLLLTQNSETNCLARTWYLVTTHSLCTDHLSLPPTHPPSLPFSLARALSLSLALSLALSLSPSLSLSLALLQFLTTFSFLSFSFSLSLFLLLCTGICSLLP